MCTLKFKWKQVALTELQSRELVMYKVRKLERDKDMQRDM